MATSKVINTLWKEVGDLLSGRQIFQFIGLYSIPHSIGSSSALDLCYDFGMECLSRNIFHLPYTSVAYLSPIKSSGWIYRALLCDEIDGEIMISCLSISDDGGVCHNGTFKIYMSPLRENRFAYATELYDWRMDNPSVDEETWHHCMWSVCADAVQQTVLLSSKSVQVRSVLPSSALNKKRVKNGKPPFVEYKTVNLILPSGKYAMSPHKGGSHSSPRMHWRRGHIRELSDGRLVPVSPCIVGAAEDGIILKEYRARLSA